MVCVTASWVPEVFAGSPDLGSGRRYDIPGPARRTRSVRAQLGSVPRVSTVNVKCLVSSMEMVLLHFNNANHRAEPSKYCDLIL